MRTITNHQVTGANETLVINVLDEPGQGGANHEYEISSPGENEPPCSSLEPTQNGVRCVISFQNGPIKEFGVNGVTQEALLAIVIDRLQCFQVGPFASADNEEALKHFEAGIFFLQKRTRDRVTRGVEGTNVK